jgi:hypothetical protein
VSDLLAILASTVAVPRDAVALGHAVAEMITKQVELRDRLVDRYQDLLRRSNLAAVLDDRMAYAIRLASAEGLLSEEEDLLQGLRADISMLTALGLRASDPIRSEYDALLAHRKPTPRHAWRHRRRRKRRAT